MRSLVKLVAAIVFAALGTASVVAGAAPQIGAIITAHDSTASLPDFNTLAERSVMYDSAGTEMQFFSADENREPVTLADVPTGVIDAVLAVEDSAFYLHKGVNIRSLIRATLVNVSAGSVVQGGSTITQQVVKLGLVGSKRDAHRKIREAMYALRLERTLTKGQILERYLNSVYFGNGAYGVQAAAEVYFGRPLASLTLADGAFLAGMIRNPTGYDPFRHPQAFMARRQVALDRLVAYGRMTKADAAVAAAVLPPTKSFRTPQRQATPTYFVERAKEVLLNDPTILGDSAQERYNALFKGGLKIYTTFDPRLQKAAEDSRSIMPDTGGQFEAAIASLDSRTGAVKALVGGPGFDTYQFDLSTQGRNQAGSSFKTFVLVSALEQGARPDDLLDGTPGCSFDIPNQPPYTPAGHGSGVERVDTQFANSINCAYVRLGLIDTPAKVQETAERMGIPKGILKPFASIALGTFGVSPLNMASVYATLADDGVRHSPYYIDRIEDRDGNIIYQHVDAGVQAVDPNIARTAISIMKGVITNGTARKAKLADREAAGKTGTTNDSADVWFVGFTPEISTAVWIGSRTGDTNPVVLNGKVQVGGDFPAQIWQKYMTAALTGIKPSTFPAPAAPSTRPPMRLILPGNECWAANPTPPPGAVVDAPPGDAAITDFSTKAPPPSFTLPGGVKPLPMLDPTLFQFANCTDIAAALANQPPPTPATVATTIPPTVATTTTLAPTTVATTTTKPAATTSAGPTTTRGATTT